MAEVSAPLLAEKPLAIMPDVSYDTADWQNMLEAAPGDVEHGVGEVPAVPAKEGKGPLGVGFEGNRELYKVLSSAGLAANFGVFLHLRRKFPVLVLISTLWFAKNTVAIWGQDTPCWLVPGSPSLFVLIYIIGIPSMLWMLVGCPESSDSLLEFPHRDILAVTMVVFGLGFSLAYELGRFRWKKLPEHKGRLHTVGLASLCMHPNYFGDVFTYNGWALAGGTKCAFGLSLFQLPTFVWWVIPISDAYLAQRYPDEFPAYAAKTATLIPFLRSAFLNRLLAWICCATAVYASASCNESCA